MQQHVGLCSQQKTNSFEGKPKLCTRFLRENFVLMTIDLLEVSPEFRAARKAIEFDRGRDDKP